MEFETVNKRAQDQIDQILAEVARLTEVAKEMEKKNETAQASFDTKTKSLEESMAFLTNKKATIESNTAKVKEDFITEQRKLSEIKTDVQVLVDRVAELDVVISQKKNDIILIEESEMKTVKKFEKMVADKKSELAETEKKTNETLSSFEDELASLKVSIIKAENELAILNQNLVFGQAKLDEVARETKRMINEAELAEQRLATANIERQDLDAELVTLAEEKTMLLADVEPLRKQVEGEKEQIKALTKERIQQHEANRAVIAELNQREAALREKYEEVGLEYK